MTKSDDDEEKELRATFEREAKRLAPYHRKQRLAALASLGTVLVLWVLYFGFSLVVLGRLSIRLTVVFVLGTVALGAIIHRKLAPRNLFTGD